MKRAKKRRNLTHTVQIALALNARVVSDGGAPVANLVGPVVYLWIWLPAFLYTWFRKPPAIRGRVRRWWQRELAAWRVELPVMRAAAWGLLIGDWRFYGPAA
jgi:hypothetical protein